MNTQKTPEFDSLTDYDGRWQKQRISFNKFVGVVLQTTFDGID